MLQFFYSVLASVVGGIILLIGAGIVSNKARWVLTGLLARLVGADLEFVYQSKKPCESDLRQDLKKTRKLSIIVPRGNELQRDVFLPIFLEKPNAAKKNIRILMPRTRDIGNEKDWVEQREQELGKFDKAFGTGLLKKQIEANIHFLIPFVDLQDIEVRFFNAPHTGRIVVTDNFAYFGALTSEIHARDTKVYKYRKGGAMYLNYLRLFNQLWEIGKDEEIEEYRA